LEVGNLPKYDGWEPLRDDRDPQREKTLGSGGQGTVYLARSPQQVEKRRHADARIRGCLQQITSGRYEATELASCVLELAGPDPVSSLGALKQFKIRADDKDEAAKAVGRLESEVQALEALRDHPAVLKLLHANVAERFIVTQYHPRGTLDRYLKRYKGNALAALEAFKPLADGIWQIHQQGMIHRDIKPENIFVTESGDLVLGDFGIVFFQEGTERLTTPYERVGSHYWMAPWAYKNVKLELSKISPALDIFPLAKVLWSMIAGVNGFPYWEYDHDENNLERLFPDDPFMPRINGILAKCIVREEAQCDSSSQTLRARVDSLIREIKIERGYRPDGASSWPCRVCGKGHYGHSVASYQAKPYSLELNVHLCDHCGHAELFDTRRAS
jgi:serine/threonine protein kinase